MVFSLILPKILLIDKKAKHTSWVLKTWVLYKKQHDKPSKEEERELESREGEEEEEKKKRTSKEEERENTYKQAPNDQICKFGEDELRPPRPDLGLI